MENNLILAELKDIAAYPYAHLQNWKIKTGGKILGYFCINTPEEIIQGAGFLPVRLLASPERISLASKHLQSYSCSLVQSCLESALRGELDFLDGTIFPHTCDSIQRLSDIWAENLRFPFHWDLVLPVKLHTESARFYLIQELHRLRLGLQEFIGRTITDDDLRSSIALANANRSLLREIYQRKTSHAGLFSAAEFSAIVKTATFLPKEDHNHKLNKLLSRAEEVISRAKGGIRLFLIGSVCDQPQVFDLLDNCRASIVGDDLCTGWRYFSEDVSVEGDPIEALADRFIRRVPCPCKFNPGIDRAGELLKRIEGSQAQGVVFILLKFCDPHAFDYPYLKGKLEEHKIQSLLLEIEPGGLPIGAMETRLRAFVETLES
ncbi:MAG: 2-hydroxyacyl-CoA dehydratase [Deltaproteobacteria bacterium]|nr:2-hydroxyacyl-CoA dehydratase [Deltaproteobacteria bacterium]MBM4333316.1 2-hydroxyacyl-CoA dehydratase [Deltaproteobacteria bacterium]